MSAQAEGARGSEDRGLIGLLLAMTVVTGAVDAVSILSLGRVFVANMTGNVAFLGFALAGAKGFSILASLVALGAFLVGAALVGRRFASIDRRRRTLGQVARAEAGLLALATVVLTALHGTGARYGATILLAVAMGAQNAFARRLAVPDLTTTVLTQTLTGLASDRWDQPTARVRRRLAAVGAILVGAAGGALLVVDASTGWAMAAASALMAVIAVTALMPAPAGGP